MVLDLVPGMNYVYVTREKTDTLKAASVSAEIPMMRVVNDTIIYNAATANLLEGDSALEILRQMPGVQIGDNGKITVFGETVKRTYVNGIMIFGEAPTSAFQSIPSEEILQIKSYDELSVKDRKTGQTEGKHERVLDIRTRNRIERAFDGHVILAGGMASGRSIDGIPRFRYHSGITANYYSELLLTYVNALYNNTGSRSNAIGTAAQGIIPAGTSYIRLAHVQAGIEKYWNSRLFGSSLKFSYTFGDKSDRSVSHSRSAIVETENSPAMTSSDTSRISSHAVTHDLNLSFTLPFKKAGELSMDNRLSFSGKSSDNEGMSRVSLSEAQCYSMQRDATASKGLYYDGALSYQFYSSSKYRILFLANASVADDGTDRAVISDDATSSAYRRNLTMSSQGKRQEIGGTLKYEHTILDRDSRNLSASVSYLPSYSNHTDVRTGLDGETE